MSIYFVLKNSERKTVMYRFNSLLRTNVVDKIPITGLSAESEKPKKIPLYLIFLRSKNFYSIHSIHKYVHKAIVQYFLFFIIHMPYFPFASNYNRTIQSLNPHITRIKNNSLILIYTFIPIYYIFVESIRAVSVHVSIYTI